MRNYNGVIVDNWAPMQQTVCMRLANRQLLCKLMAIQGVSQRRLAVAAGYRSHTYMGRLMRGEVTTLESEPAMRIAKFLGVGVDDLFLVKLSGSTVHSGRSQRRPANAPR